MRIHWIWLAEHPDLSETEKSALVTFFHDPEELYFADPDRSGCDDALIPLIRKIRENRSLSAAQRILESCARENIEIIPLDDPRYPERLRNIPDPPLVLYCKGEMPRVDETAAIGVVGTRNASAYGLNIAWRMGYQLSRCGGIVVSGLAAGIDSMAMRGALRAGGKVIGVSACGLDRVYPKSNRTLYDETRQSGCLLSEYPPGVQPYKWNFPRRNRIISGLSCGVLVVEAPERSGALITAHQANDQGRDVFVVPGNVDMPGFAGSYRLMREGALPVRTGWDILSEYEVRFPDSIRRDLSEAPESQLAPGGVMPETAAKVAQSPLQPGENRAAQDSSDKKSIDKGSHALYIDLNETLEKLSGDERRIVEALKNGERLVDEVIAETGLTTGKMLAAMTMLELKGILSRLPGKRIRLK